MSLRNMDESELKWDAILTFVEQGNINDDPEPENVKANFEFLDELANSTDGGPVTEWVQDRICGPSEEKGHPLSPCQVMVPDQATRLGEQFCEKFLKREIGACWDILAKINKVMTAQKRFDLC